MTRVLVSALYRRASASLLCSPGLSSALEAALPAAQALPRSSSTSGALLSRARAAPFALVPVRQGWFFSSQGGGQQQPGGRREEPPSHNQQAGEKVSAHVSFFVKEEAPEFPGDAEGVEGAGGPDDGWSEAKASGSEAVVKAEQHVDLEADIQELQEVSVKRMQKAAEKKEEQHRRHG